MTQLFIVMDTKMLNKISNSQIRVCYGQIILSNKMLNYFYLNSLIYTYYFKAITYNLKVITYNFKIVTFSSLN